MQPEWLFLKSKTPKIISIFIHAIIKFNEFWIDCAFLVLSLCLGSFKFRLSSYFMWYFQNTLKYFKDNIIKYNPRSLMRMTNHHCSYWNKLPLFTLFSAHCQNVNLLLMTIHSILLRLHQKSFSPFIQFRLHHDGLKTRHEVSE